MEHAGRPLTRTAAADGDCLLQWMVDSPVHPAYDTIVHLLNDEMPPVAYRFYPSTTDSSIWYCQSLKVMRTEHNGLRAGRSTATFKMADATSPRHRLVFHNQLCTQKLVFEPVECSPSTIRVSVWSRNSLFPDVRYVFPPLLQ